MSTWLQETGQDACDRINVSDVMISRRALDETESLVLWMVKTRFVRTYDNHVEFGAVQLAGITLEFECDSSHLLGREPSSFGGAVIILDGDLADVDANDTLCVGGDGS
jgi:hypothetical protein